MFAGESKSESKSESESESQRVRESWPPWLDGARRERPAGVVFGGGERSNEGLQIMDSV